MLGRMALSQETRIEKAMRIAFKNAGLAPIQEYVAGYYAIDFAFIAAKIAVECDGDYWHSRPERKVKDRCKDTYLKRRGWKVVRLTETQIKADPVACVAIVQEFLAASADKSYLPI